MFRKLFCIVLSVIMLSGLLTACGKSGQTDKNGKLSVVCTIFPQYDWVKEITDGTETAEITMLLDNGTDLHSYQPTADDMIKISQCDMFVYVGGESDKWVNDALKNAANDNMKVINLLDLLGAAAKEEEAVEGMQTEEEDEEEGDEEEGPEYDEHVWLSLKNAGIFVKDIAKNLAEIDSANAEKYNANSASYIEKLNQLDTEYRQTVDTAKRKTLLFGDRFPFRYLTDDYGLKYYAAFIGCSAETEASFETFAFLSSKVDEAELTTVLTIEGTQHKIAETIIANTKNKNQQVLSLDSMQAVTSKDAAGGISYLSVMKKNLDVLKKALN